MPKYYLEVDAKVPTLTVIADITFNTRKTPLPGPVYDDIMVRPTLRQQVRLDPGDYVMDFDVQNGAGEFTISIKDATGAAIASQSFKAPPQIGQNWYFKLI